MIGNGLLRLVRFIGRRSLFFLSEVGKTAILLYRILKAAPSAIAHRKLLMDQMMAVGLKSFMLITVISLFSGAVTSWQAAFQFRGVLPGNFSMDYLGSAVSAAIFIELSPVFAGLVVAGRVGASIAAELGSMRVTEQIDALEALAIDPVEYLAVPRFFAGLFMLPILVIYANLIAHGGAFFVANGLLDVSAPVFFSSIQNHFLLINVMAGLLKALVFGGGTALIGCSIGFRSGEGAAGVGQATIRAFVFSAGFILITDYILAMLLF
jgi:phospholipid/cholesterol/gamma-HCH transport system permease protein